MFSDIARYANIMRRLGLLVENGVALPQALSVLVEDETLPATKRRLERMCTAANDGRSHAEILSVYFDKGVPLPLLGKVTAVPNLSVLLLGVADFLDEKLHFWGNVREKLRYPMLLFITFFGILFLFFFVLAPLIRQFVAEQQFPGAFILDFGMRIASWGITPFVTLFFVVATLLAVFGMRVKRWFLWICLGSGPSDYLELIGIFLQSGFPIVVAVNAVGEGPGQDVSALSRFRERFLGTGQFSKSWVEAFESSAYVRQLLEAGETSRDFSKILRTLAQKMRQDLWETRRGTLVKIQVTMLLVIGLLVGVSLWLVYMPLFLTIRQF